MQIPSAPPSPVSSSGKLVSSRLQSWATARGHSVATHQSHLHQNRSQTMRQSSLGSAKEASSISGLSQRCCKRFRSSSSSPRFWGSCSSPWWKWGAGYRTPANEYNYIKYLADRILSKTSGNLQKRKFPSLQVQITDRILEYSICGFVYIYRVSCKFDNRFGHAVSKIYIAVLVWCCWEYSICWFVCIYAMFYGFFVQFHIE